MNNSTLIIILIIIIFVIYFFSQDPIIDNFKIESETLINNKDNKDIKDNNDGNDHNDDNELINRIINRNKMNRNELINRIINRNKIIKNKNYDIVPSKIIKKTLYSIIHSELLELPNNYLALDIIIDLFPIFTECLTKVKVSDFSESLYYIKCNLNDIESLQSTIDNTNYLFNNPTNPPKFIIQPNIYHLLNNESKIKEIINSIQKFINDTKEIFEKILIYKIQEINNRNNGIQKVSDDKDTFGLLPSISSSLPKPSENNTIYIILNNSLLEISNNNNNDKLNNFVDYLKTVNLNNINNLDNIPAKKYKELITIYLYDISLVQKTIDNINNLLNNPVKSQEFTSTENINYLLDNKDNIKQNIISIQDFISKSKLIFENLFKKI